VAEIDVEALTRQGRGIIRFGWIANALFAITAILVAAGLDGLIGVAIAVALLLFFVSVGVFVYAFVVALARSSQGDNVAVANLFFLQGSAPKPVKRQFLWIFLVCLAVAAGTAAWEPFGVLVPMLPVGLAGMWAARYGVFPPRPVPQSRRGA
jgi:Na+/phosphate symporter